MIYDLIIIGAGPAGMTAGIYACRQGLNVLLITKDFGGQMSKKMYDVENYPGFNKITGNELIEKFKNQLMEQDIEVVMDEVVSIAKKEDKFIVLTKEKSFESLAVIISSGADPRILEAPGEKEFIGKGVSYCALCDGPLFRNKEVAVIGGGNSGIETAVFLSNYVKKIYVVDAGSAIKADQKNQDILKKTGKAEILLNSRVKEIKGTKMVETLVLEDRVLKVSGVFIEIGYSPATAFVKDLVDFTDRDEIIIEPETCQTKTPGLFAAGDVNQGKYKQIITASGEGAKAALAAYNFLKNK